MRGEGSEAQAEEQTTPTSRRARAGRLGAPLHKRHRESDEDGRQDQGEEDQQPIIVRLKHPQGQHGGGGGNRAGARPGRNRFALRVA